MLTPAADLHVPLDHLPAARLEHHAAGDAVLLEDQIDHAPGAQVAWRNDQAVGADVGERHPPLAPERMSLAGDEHRLVIADRVVDEIVRHVDHRADREIHLVGPEQRHAVASGDVVQPDVDLGEVRREALDRLGQGVEQGRFAGSDVERTGDDLAEPRGEAIGQSGEAVDQRLRHLLKESARRRQPDLRTRPFEQQGVEVLLERLDLQRDRRLAQLQTLGGLRHAAGLRRVAERAQLAEPIQRDGVGGGHVDGRRGSSIIASVNVSGDQHWLLAAPPAGRGRAGTGRSRRGSQTRW